MEVMAVIGLGYVGLPLAVALSKHFKTIGFDIDQNRILELQNGQDRTLEISAKDLSNLDNLSLTDDLTKLNQANFFIVTVPTPVDDANQPDFSPLISATRSIASILKKGDIIVYESTVYPGATEEICVPLLEDISKLKFNKDFLVGYSPERINPGDKNHHLADITKIISGSNSEALNRIEKVYEKIIKAGLHKTSSIKVAEAAKVIENTQRDINIALINELAMLFEKLGIDTKEVLDAAGTKWNFQRFSPGLVGGHCIGVDPYYLTYKAALVDFHPELILAGRKTNDNMSNYIAGRALKELSKNKRSLHGSKCLLLGLTFKENCPDLRNSGALTLKKVLESYGIIVTTCDPWAALGNLSDSQKASHINLNDIQNFNFDIAIIAVAHNQFKEIGPVLRNASPEGIIFDLKSCIDANFVNLRL
jgi:UDP-N-acetyl-D-galactosamine dehydrogenase